MNWRTAVILLVMSSTALAGNVLQQTAQQADGEQMWLATPDNLKWVPIRPGNEMAVVYGDPSKAGELYAVRFRFADGFKVPAHWHPQDEHATVLQGTLLLGMGKKWDERALTTTLTTGAYVFVPKEMPHFALARGGTVLQAHGIGPFQIIYVDPADDPRNQPAPR